MQLSESDKITVLLNLLDRQIDEIQRREETEQKLFEWSTSLLLASFAGIVALSQRTALPNPVFVKLLATVMVGIPICLAIAQIKSRSAASVGNAETVERIQNLLHLFEDGYYGAHSPYPPEWAGGLAKGRLKRTSPVHKSIILGLMAACVIATIWVIL